MDSLISRLLCFAALGLAACGPPQRVLTFEAQPADAHIDARFAERADTHVVPIGDSGLPREARPTVDFALPDCAPAPALDATRTEAGTVVKLSLDPSLTGSILAPVPPAAPFIDGINPKCAGIWHDEETLAGPYEGRLYFGFTLASSRPVKKAVLSLPGLNLVNATGRTNRLYLETVAASSLHLSGASPSALFTLPPLAEVGGSPFATLPPTDIDVTSLVAGAHCGQSVQFRMRWDRSADPSIVDISMPMPGSQGVCPSSALFFYLTVTY